MINHYLILMYEKIDKPYVKEHMWHQDPLVNVFDKFENEIGVRPFDIDLERTRRFDSGQWWMRYAHIETDDPLFEDKLNNFSDLYDYKKLSIKEYEEIQYFIMDRRMRRILKESSDAKPVAEWYDPENPEGSTFKFSEYSLCKLKKKFKLE